MTAGKLRERVTIIRNVAVPDWTGSPGDPDWRDQFTTAASIEFMRGSETVLASRLQAKQPAIVRMRNSPDARGVLPTDRVRNARTGETFNVREVPRESRANRGYLEVLIESGVD